MTEQININPLRFSMIQDAIAAHPDAEISVAGLAPFLPEDFQLGDDDLWLVTREGEQPKNNEQPAAEPAAQEQPSSPEPEPELSLPTAEEIANAVERRNRAEQNLVDTRIAVQVAHRRIVEAQTRLAQVVSAFQKGFTPVSETAAFAAHVKSQNEIRQAIKEGRMMPPSRHGRTVGRSVVDQIRSYQRGGNPAQGDLGRRGAFPASYIGRVNNDPRRGNVGAAPKVPSER